MVYPTAPITEPKSYMHQEVYKGRSPEDTELYDLNETLAKMEAIEIPVREANEKETRVARSLLEQGSVLKAQYAETPICSADEKQELEIMDFQLLALKYRTGVDLEEFTEDQTDQLKVAMTHLLRSAKDNQSLYVHEPGTTHPISEYDEAQITKVCTKYPEFARLILMRNQWDPNKPDVMPKLTDIKGYTGYFFKWSFRAGLGRGIAGKGNSVGVFVKMPNERFLLTKHLVDTRAGVVDQTKGIKFVKQKINGETKKVLALRMRARDVIGNNYVRIQGDHKKDEVRLPSFVKTDPHPSTDFVLSVLDVYKQVESSKYNYPDVEYSEYGITNWSTIKLASYNPRQKREGDHHVGGYDRVRPLGDRTYLDKIPATFNLSRKRLQQLYPDQKVPQQGEQGYILRMTRTTTDKNIFATHAFEDVISETRDGRIRLHSFGKQMDTIPTKALQKADQISDTVPAGMHTPDCSSFTNTRDHVGKVIVTTPKQQEKLINKLGSEIHKAREGNLYFQMAGENCASSTMKLHNEVMGLNVINKLRDLSEKLILDTFDAGEIKYLLKRSQKFYEDESLDLLLNKLIPALFPDKEPTKHIEDVLNLIEVIIELFEATTLKDNDELLEGVKTIKDELKLTRSNIETQLSEDQAVLGVKESLRDLIILSCKSQQYFRMNLKEASFFVPLQGLINNINSIKWEWLKNLLLRFLLFLIGSWRGYTTRKIIDGKTHHVRQSLFAHPFNKKHNMRHPGMLVDSIRWEKENGKSVVTAIKTSTYFYHLLRKAKDHKRSTGKGTVQTIMAWMHRIQTH